MELKELLNKCINDRLIDLTISGQKVKDEGNDGEGEE